MKHTNFTQIFFLLIIKNKKKKINKQKNHT